MVRSWNHVQPDILGNVQVVPGAVGGDQCSPCAEDLETAVQVHDLRTGPGLQTPLEDPVRATREIVLDHVVGEREVIARLPMVSCPLDQRPGCPQRKLVYVFRDPGMMGNIPLKTRRPCPSALKPCQRKSRVKRPDCETPSMIVTSKFLSRSQWCALHGASLKSPSGFELPWRSLSSLIEEGHQIANGGKPIPITIGSLAG